MRRLFPSGDFDFDFLIENLNRPRGIAVLDDNTLAISDTENHQIQVIDFNNEANSYTIGNGSAGFADGEVSVARFNRPQKIAAAPNGSLVIADRLNHRVRTVNPTFSTQGSRLRKVQEIGISSQKVSTTLAEFGSGLIHDFSSRSDAGRGLGR